MRFFTGLLCPARLRYFAAGVSTGLLLLPLSTLAAWEKNVDVFFAGSDDASVTGIRWLQPWRQTGNSLTFSDMRLMRSDKATEELNLGGGYRRFNPEETGIWGAYGFLDYRLSASNHAFSQITLGGEYLTDTWDYRANLYVPIKDQYVIQQLPDEITTVDRLEGHSLNRVTTRVPGGLQVEEALQGMDIEAGRILPGSEDFEIRTFLGFYQYEADIAGSTTGTRLRLETFPRQSFKVNFTLENDDLFGTRSYLELNMPLGKRLGRPGKRSLYQRMTQFAYRDIDVRETSRLGVDKRTKNGPGSQQAISNTQIETTTPVDGIAHIDSRSTSTTPDGSIENPYKTIAQCQGSATTYSCTSTEANIIYLHAAAVTTAEPTAQTYVGNLTLNAEQQLLGDGITSGFFADISTGTAPILLGNNATGSTTPVVELNNDNRVEGLQLGWHFPDGTTLPVVEGEQSAMPDIAIRGVNVETFALRDLYITGYNVGDAGLNESNNFTRGIQISNSIVSPGTSLPSEQNGTLRNVHIDYSLGDGLSIFASAPGNTTIKQNVVITDSSIRRSGRGLHISADGASDSHVNQSISLVHSNPSSTSISNTIEQNLNEGILIENLQTNLATVASLGFTADQDLVVKNTMIRDNQGAGIQTFFSQTPGGVLGVTNRTSTVELENTNLLQNEGSGLVLENNGGHSVAELRNVTIVGNIEKAGTTTFGQRLDGYPIDCEQSGSCTSTGTNPARVAKLHTGFGIYARNRDYFVSNGDPDNISSTQEITISENFRMHLHGENSAQIYMFSDSVQNSTSQQNITVLRPEEEPNDEAEYIKELYNLAGEEVVLSNGQSTVGIKAGAISPRLLTCDGSDDDNALNLALGGQLQDLQDVEETCLP